MKVNKTFIRADDQTSRKITKERSLKQDQHESIIELDKMRALSLASYFS